MSRRAFPPGPRRRRPPVQVRWRARFRGKLFLPPCRPHPYPTACALRVDVRERGGSMNQKLCLSVFVALIAVAAIGVTPPAAALDPDPGWGPGVLIETGRAGKAAVP